MNNILWAAIQLAISRSVLVRRFVRLSVRCEMTIQARAVEWPSREARSCGFGLPIDWLFTETVADLKK